MERQLKNKVFTLVIGVLLLGLAVVLLLGGLNVRGFSFARTLFKGLMAAFFVLYAVGVVLPLSSRFGGKARGFATAEFLLVLLLALGQGAACFFRVPLFSLLSICASIGVVLWLRGAMEIICMYLKKEDGKSRLALARLCGSILICALGVWQVASPALRDRDFLLYGAALCFVGAAAFAVLTYRNFRAKRRVSLTV